MNDNSSQHVKVKKIRIAAGQGFWGDWLEAPKHQVRRGAIDYLMLDYLAEVTMSILAKQREKHPEAGYAHDFVDLMDELLPELCAKNIKVLANAGGVNPLACGKAVRNLVAKHGISEKLRIAVVHGDDITSQLGELLHAGHMLSHLESGAPFKDIQARVRSANVYFGSAPLLEALRGGAHIVISGRVADPSLVLAPLMHEFNWAADAWNLLASGTIAGHIIECGPQCSGGNSSFDWECIPQLSDVGYPIVEAESDGTFVVTKHDGTGGRVSIETIKEQLVYEIGDPGKYISPDVIADFTSIRLESAGENRVRVSPAKGKPRPEMLKTSVSYFDGYMSAGTLVYSWPQAYEKAIAAGEIVRRRLADAGVHLERIHTEIIGVDACHGMLAAGEHANIAEVTLRIAVQDRNRAAVERFTREMAPLVLSGPPSATAYSGGKGDIKEVFAYWPALIRRTAVQPLVTFV